MHARPPRSSQSRIMSAPPAKPEDDDAALSTDARPTAPPASDDIDLATASTATLQALLVRERAAHAETTKDLQVERAAHDETAEKMVQLQQRLEVTLQELANLERFTKRQQTVTVPPGTAPHVERLRKEESYLKSRLLFVQQELADAHGAAKSVDGAQDAEDRAIDTALSI